MSTNDAAELERIADELGYPDWAAVPEPVKNNVRACGPDNVAVTDDAFAETFGRIADALE